MSGSLRCRLVWSTGLTVGLLVAMTSLAVWWFGRQLLYERLDDDLRQVLDARKYRVLGEYFMERRRAESDGDERHRSPGLPDDGYRWILYDHDGRSVLYSSSDINAGTAAALAGSARAGVLDEVEIADRRLRRWSVILQRMPRPGSRRPRRGRDRPETPPEDGSDPPGPTGPEAREEERRENVPELQFGLCVLRDTADTEAAVRDLGWSLAVTSVLSALLCALAGLLIARSALRPLVGLGSRIAAIDADDLGERIRLVRTPTELVPVVDGLNAALARLADAFERERTLNANLAHELRTPLAVIRSELEQVPDVAADSAVANALEAARRMQDLVENLLLLAKLEAGSLPVRTEAVDLADAVTAAWTAHAKPAAGRGLSCACRIPLTLAVQVDPTHLRIILTNLLGNAVAHAAAGGGIEVRGHLTDAVAVLTIVNDCGEAAINTAMVFQPYWRADAARGTDGAHFGLGLALVRRLVEVNGGTVRAQQDLAARHFAIVVELPGDGEAPSAG